MKPMTKATAQKYNTFIQVTPNDTEKTIRQALTGSCNHCNRYWYICTNNQQELVLDMIAYDPVLGGLIDIYDPKTGKMLFKSQHILQVLHMLLHNNHTNELVSGNLSIFLDERNLDYYLNQAKNVMSKYGFNKIPNMTITGQQYYDNMKEMTSIAHSIINGQIPQSQNIFDCIPIKKDNTFLQNRKIPVFKNNLYTAEAYENYIDKSELVLCIMPDPTHVYPDRYGWIDWSERTCPTKARLCISPIEGARKIQPLVNKNLTINDLTAKTTYLKKDQVKPGGIYQETSGTEYLYLGRIQIIFKDYLVYTNQTLSDYMECEHHYIRITKAIQNMISKAPDFDTFLKQYLEETFGKSKTFKFSTRTTPRKFVKQTATPYINTPFSIINPMSVTVQTAIPIFYLNINDNQKDGCKICIVQ